MKNILLQYNLHLKYFHKNYYLINFEKYFLFVKYQQILKYYKLILDYFLNEKKI